MSNKKEEKPQVDEDDLDDLDDYLDEFQDEILNETIETNKQQDELSNLLNQLENDSPEAKQIFDTLLKDLNQESSEQPTDTNLKDTISSTLNRLKESGPKVDQEIKDEDPTKLLSDLLNNLSMGEGGEGLEGADGFSIDNLLKDLVEQLASKAVLYEPLKDLSVKYPKWLEENKDIEKEEYDKYVKQNEIIQAIITKFESPNYSDENDKEFISQKLEEMQNSGNPPKELVGDMNKVGLPGFNFDDDDLPQEEIDKDIEKQLEENCAQQ